MDDDNYGTIVSRDFFLKFSGTIFDSFNITYFKFTWLGKASLTEAILGKHFYLHTHSLINRGEFLVIDIVQSSTNVELALLNVSKHT